MGPELRYKVDLAIQLLADFKGLLIYDKIINLFKENGINKVLADDIYIFLPIIFCRKLLSTVDFPESYYEQDNINNKKEKYFNDNHMYKLIEASSNDYFENAPNSEIILKIASLSPEFNAINNLLTNGGNLEDVKLTKIIILK